MRGLTMKAPRTLPRVPEDEAVRKLLLTCDPDTFEGRRNRALIALLADSGYTISEKPCAFAWRTSTSLPGPSA